VNISSARLQLVTRAAAGAVAHVRSTTDSPCGLTQVFVEPVFNKNRPSDAAQYSSIAPRAFACRELHTLEWALKSLATMAGEETAYFLITGSNVFLYLERCLIGGI